jgi:hypothetical protein
MAAANVTTIATFRRKRNNKISGAINVFLSSHTH